ncbi:MAG: GFA family protein [Hyphomicrobiales bacterium]|nr:GFA family protein [Hyphomicrobiales bacterium]
MNATCQCGQLSVLLPEMTAAVVACHCRCCQKRTGSPFGVLAYYPSALLKITGVAVKYERAADSGGVFETYFCATCGSTVYARAAKHPTMLGVAIGAITEAAFPAPIRSVWEESRHHWVTIPEPAEHFSHGRP